LKLCHFFRYFDCSCFGVTKGLENDWKLVLNALAERVAANFSQRTTRQTVDMAARWASSMGVVVFFAFEPTGAWKTLYNRITAPSE
jgi:hypothetical protein